MADKSFEQRVQDELGSLKIQPGEEVWLQVEAGLHKEKKRRWFLWLFLFAGVAAAGVGGYFLRNRGEGDVSVDQHIVSSLAKPLPDGTTAKPLQPSHETSSATVALAPEIKPAVPHGAEPQSNRNNISSFNTSSPSNKRGLPARTPIIPKPISEEPKRLQTDVNVSSSVTTSIHKENGDAKAATTLSLSSSEKMQDSLQTTVAANPESVPVKTSNTDSVRHETVQQPAATPAPAVVPSNQTRKSKWKLGVAVDAGVSGTSDKLFSVIRPVFYDPNYANGSVNAPGSGTITPGATGSNPPSVKKAAGFGIQLQASKQLNKTVGVGFSLGYTLFQTATAIGRRIDSTVFFSVQNAYNSNGYYYVAADSTPYTNRYHFLKLGIDLNTSFSLFRIPLRWQAGIGMHYLVGSNGLHYDATSRRSYQNNDLFRRVQPYFSTGIDFAFGKEPYLYIGPHVQGNLRSLTTSGSGQYLLMGSLQVTFMLPKHNTKKK